MASESNSYRSKKGRPSSCCPDSVFSSNNSNSSSNKNNNNNNNNSKSSCVAWSGFETIGMRRAKCSLLLQDDIIHDAMIKKLPKQRVLIDRGVRTNPPNAATRTSSSSSSSTNSNASDISINPAFSSSSSVSSSASETKDRNHNNNHNNNHSTENNYSTDEPYYVNFDGATILQLEPSISPLEPQSVMPVTITVAGKCVLTPENYIDFQVMMRTKEQSSEMNIPPNGTFDWPDITSFLLCPVCSNICSIPRLGDRQEHEYWMVYYPLIQIAIRNHDNDNSNSNSKNSNNTNTNVNANANANEMVLSTRTICRLTCLDCMDDLLEGLSLNVIPGGLCKERSNSPTTAAPNTKKAKPTVKGLAFSLPVVDILAEAGSVSFLEGGPPRPDTHQHLDDILDAWTLYNLWECSGAWEALQNDYRMQLTKSLSPVPISNQENTTNDGEVDSAMSSVQASWMKRIGQKCASESCHRIHGKTTLDNGEVCRLSIKCQDCHSELYCSKSCRDDSRVHHADMCRERRKQREERRERYSRKQIQCDTCARKFPCTKMKKCSSCRHATYCSVDCQKVDWERHKSFCKR